MADARTSSDEGRPRIGDGSRGYVLAARIAAIVGAASLLGCHANHPPDEATPLPARSTTVVAPEDPTPCASPQVRIVGPAESPADTTLVMLHGYGADSANIEPAARALARAWPHLVAIVPDGCEPAGRVPGGRQWWGIRDVPESGRTAALAAAGGRVARFVDAELQRRGLPRDRVVWAGFSQGAILSQWMAVHAAPRPLAVLSFSGRFDDDAPAGPPVGTPVLLVHGELDPVIPFAESQRAEQALVARGARVERLDRPQMAHAIDGESLTAGVAFLRRTLGPR